MSNFVVSARKYRPDHFDTVVGQPSVTNTLKNAIRSGHIAHAYLFCGPRGVGKTTCARIFARTLNCFNLTEETEACGQCESCKSFNESRSYNIHELDAASNNSVDDIRSLIDKVRIIPQVGKYSIYIIDEVHMLSQQAFNAFLKTLEEPPEHAIFILATTEKHKIIPTILSRCQIFDFQRIRVDDIVASLAGVAKKENIVYEEEALNVIALKADGAMRDALSIFDQVASFSNRNITYHEVLDNLNVLDYEYYFKLTSYFLEGSATQALLLFNEILQKGFDGQNFIGGLSSHFRELLVSRDESTLSLLEVSDVLKKRYRDQSRQCEADFLFSALEICSQCELTFKASRNQRLHVELALIRLSNIVSEKKKPVSEPTGIAIPELAKPGAGGNTVTQKVEVVQKPTLKKPDPVPEIQNKSVPPPEAKKAVTDAAPHTISIKQALESVVNKPKIQVEETESISEDPDMLDEAVITEKQDLNMDTLRIAWMAFSEKLREERPRMSVTLRKVEPRIAENCLIVVEMNNRVQLEDFNNNTKNELEKYLRSEMHNGDIRIEAGIVESPQNEQQKLYTSEEKFRYLSEKNPALVAFRQKLNLELE
ncbi:MAG TPA: DNA polymerase III subunit gamma/tau [Bacteroidales bacterium]|nr:DNA polymerase III subunit gamma/tau [Bacteroidales bacterium]